MLAGARIFLPTSHYLLWHCTKVAHQIKKKSMPSSHSYPVVRRKCFLSHSLPHQPQTLRGIPTITPLVHLKGKDAVPTLLHALFEITARVLAHKPCDDNNVFSHVLCRNHMERCLVHVLYQYECCSSNMHTSDFSLRLLFLLTSAEPPCQLGVQHKRTWLTCPSCCGKCTCLRIC